MKLIPPFGPRIAHFKLSDADTQSLHEICLPAKGEDLSGDLVGNLREEIDITEELKTLDALNTISANMHRYLKDVDCGMIGGIIKSGEIDTVLECTKGWYNKQIANEYNPIHDHILSAELVCVIFTKIDLDKNVKYYNNNRKEKQEGQLFFKFGERQTSGFGLSNICVTPEEGDMFVFPGYLSHYTNPVLGNSMRYSISCNFNYTNIAKRMFIKMAKDLPQGNFLEIK